MLLRSAFLSSIVVVESLEQERLEESVKSLDDDAISGRRSRVPGGDQCQSAEFSSSVNFNVLMFHVCTHELIIGGSIFSIHLSLSQGSTAYA